MAYLLWPSTEELMNISSGFHVIIFRFNKHVTVLYTYNTKFYYRTENGGRVVSTSDIRSAAILHYWYYIRKWKP